MIIKSSTEALENNMPNKTSDTSFLLAAPLLGTEVVLFHKSLPEPAFVFRVRGMLRSGRPDKNTGIE